MHVVALLLVLFGIVAATEYHVKDVTTEIKLSARGYLNDMCFVRVVDHIGVIFPQGLKYGSNKIEFVIPLSDSEYHGVFHLVQISNFYVSTNEKDIPVTRAKMKQKGSTVAVDVDIYAKRNATAPLHFKLEYYIGGILHIDTQSRVNVLKWRQLYPTPPEYSNIQIHFPSEWMFMLDEVSAEPSQHIMTKSESLVIFDAKNTMLDTAVTFPLVVRSCGSYKNQVQYYAFAYFGVSSAGVVLLLALVVLTSLAFMCFFMDELDNRDHYHLIPSEGV
jgi:hypothetical protein